MNPVTVNVYLDALLVWSDTRDPGAEGTYMPFCEVDWPGGLVTPL